MAINIDKLINFCTVYVNNYCSPSVFLQQQKVMKITSKLPYRHSRAVQCTVVILTLFSGGTNKGLKNESLPVIVYKGPEVMKHS